ncbi:MAG: Uma2 family endonuclease, partial [Verrucomicrobiales bacterium]
DINVFQPDLVFVSKAHQSLLHKDGIHGGPDLVVEILSPSTAKFDLGHKKAIYARCGVLEYWVVDPETRTLARFDFTESADDPAATLHEPGTLTSPQFPGLEISLGDVFASPELQD